jgi:glycerol-3-phosphate cytidylyltransferase
MMRVKSMPKVKTGFVAGRFNFIHMGHLALLKGAKERSERLIAGVFTNTEINPEIPAEERIEIMKSIRYADMVTELTKDNNFIRESWNKFKFDCYFTSDSAADNPKMKTEKSWLQERGADIVFLPHIPGQSEKEWKEKANNTKILAFGAGKRFELYMERRGYKYPPAYIFDNDPDKWGKTKNGILIKPPGELPALVKKGGKVLITCAEQEDIKALLIEMGITEFYTPRL